MELCLESISTYDENDFIDPDELSDWVGSNKRLLELLGELMAHEPLNGDDPVGIEYHTWITTNGCEPGRAKPINLYWSDEDTITLEYLLNDYNTGTLDVKMR